MEVQGGVLSLHVCSWKGWDVPEQSHTAKYRMTIESLLTKVVLTELSNSKKLKKKSMYIKLWDCHHKRNDSKLCVQIPNTSYFYNYQARKSRGSVNYDSV